MIRVQGDEIDQIHKNVATFLCLSTNAPVAFRDRLKGVRPCRPQRIILKPKWSLTAALFTAIPTVVKVLCLLVGCAMFAMPDFLSRVAAEGVIMQRGGAETTVSCRVNDGGVDVENGAHIPFAKIDRLVEDDQYFYIFQSRQMAVMIPKGSLLPANPERFAKVLAKETGKDWQRSKSLWGLNLKDLVQMGKDRFQRSAS